MSKMGLLSFVSSSESLKLRVALGTPELQRFIHIVVYINTQFIFLLSSIAKFVHLPVELVVSSFWQLQVKLL